MSLDYLARISSTTTESVAEQVRRAHSELSREKCMAWLHQRKFPGKDGGCDVHGETA